MARHSTATRGDETEKATTQSLDLRLAEAVERLLESGHEPLRGAFLTRGLNALSQLTAELNEHELGEATAASSNYSVLVRALAQPEALATIEKDDLLVEARLRGLAMRERFLQAEGGTFTAEQVAKHLRMTRQAVDKRRKVGRLLGFSIGRRGYVYPAWQFDTKGVLPGFEKILTELTVRDPWMQAAFFLSGDLRLDQRRPIEVLREGRVEEVCRAARGYGEQSAA